MSKLTPLGARPVVPSNANEWTVRATEGGGIEASTRLDDPHAGQAFRAQDVAVLQGTPSVSLPRVHLADPTKLASSGLASWVSAHPVASAAGAAVLGMLSLANTAQGAPLSPTAVSVPTDPAAAAKDKSIVYVGMNVDSKHEVQKLREVVGEKGVTFVFGTSEADVLKLDGTTYDLKTPEGRTAFAGKLGLAGDRAAALASVLENTGEGARDEMAQVARLFAQAEKGDRYIERIVFSGHSVGSGVWGDGNGTLSWDAMMSLGAVFPRAAGQVQDLLIAGCYSGGEEKMDNYRAVFPNVKTIWAYDGSAPGAVSGAVPHILRWERGTRGPSTDNLRRESADGTRKGENVAVWTVTRGYSNGQPPAELQSVLNDYTETKANVAKAETGELEMASPQYGPLRDHYNWIQRLLGRRDITPEQRQSLTQERDHVIRLLYYKNVGSFFQLTHKAAIESGYRDLGLQAPDFSKLDRKGVLEAIAKFDAKVAEKGGEPSRAVSYLSELLHHGLQNLETKYVPDAWL